jgi:hypothetical protein
MKPIFTCAAPAQARAPAVQTALALGGPAYGKVE